MWFKYEIHVTKYLIFKSYKNIKCHDNRNISYMLFVKHVKMKNNEKHIMGDYSATDFAL